MFAGLSLRHSRGHLFRAAYEGIAFGLRQILELLEDAGGPAERIVAVGGGTQGGLWTQIVSDVTGREQQIPAQTIGASYGDALLAAIGAGLVPPDTDWARPGRIVTPDPSTARSTRWRTPATASCTRRRRRWSTSLRTCRAAPPR